LNEYPNNGGKTIKKLNDKIFRYYSEQIALL